MSNVHTPLVEHRVQSHGCAMVEVAVTIVARERDATVSRTLEAFWRAINPKISQKDGCIALTQELAPFIDLCGFRPSSAQGRPWGRGSPPAPGD